MKKIKMLGTSFLALSSILLSSYAYEWGNEEANYGMNSSPYNNSYNTNPSGSSYNPPYSGSNTPTFQSYSGSNQPLSGNFYSSTPTTTGKSFSDTTTNPSSSANLSTQTAPKGQAPMGSGSGCGNNFDMNLFEGQDEQDAYSAYGFTRGDIYYIYRYKFDPNTIMTADGTIEKVIRVQYPDGDCYLVAILSTQDGDILVNLGPVNYFDSQRVILSEGDSIQVKGSKIRLNGRYVLIGMEVNRDGKTLPLRNEAGQPSWKQNMTGGQSGMTNTNLQNPPRTTNQYRSTYNY